MRENGLESLCASGFLSGGCKNVEQVATVAQTRLEFCHLGLNTGEWQSWVFIILTFSTCTDFLLCLVLYFTFCVCIFLVAVAFTQLLFNFFRPLLKTEVQSLKGHPYQHQK